MKIYKVTDPEFKPYGRVVDGFDVTELCQTLAEKTPLPEDVVYVPSCKELEDLPIYQDLKDRLFGGMPTQLGYCNGHNTKLNCLEYHRDSEMNVSPQDFILLLGKQDQMEDFVFDTKDTMAFFCPKNTLIEVYATSLHYAPCSAKKGEGFQVLIGLPKGTNTDKPAYTPACHEDKLMTARNKWLLAHPDSDEAKGGAVIGLKGENIDIAGDI